MNWLSIPHMIVVAVVALLIFGPRRLPELGRQVGKALAEFRRASMEIRGVVTDEIEQLERESRDVVRHTEEAMTPPQQPVGSGSIAPPGLAPSPEKPAEEEPSDGPSEKA